MLLIGVGGAKATKEVNLNFTFEAQFFAASSWDSGSRTFSWGSGGWNSDWTFININNVSGDVSKYTKLYFKLDDWENSAEEKLTLYFKEDKGNTQSMDYVAKVEITPNAEGVFEFDLTTFDWKNDANPSETIDKTNIFDVTLYGGARSGEGDGSVKITEAYLSYQATSISIDNRANLVEIPQTNAGGGDSKASAVTEDGVTTYTTTTGDICVIFKMENVDVTNCDYITMKFAEATPAGINYSFWNGTTNQELPNGTTELKYVFADDASCAISENKIPQITLLTLWVGTPKVVKVKGVYKHQVSASNYNRTYSFDQALDFAGTGIEAYVITSFNSATATLTLSRIYQVPANTGLYLVGREGDYEIPIIDSASPIATNLLHASSGEDELTQTEAEGDYTNLIFGGTGEDRGFHELSAAGVIGANKAYLQLPTSDLATAFAAKARLELVFEDSTTAVSEVKGLSPTPSPVSEGSIFNVAGQRMSKLQKGVNIVNGKKVLVK